MLLNAWKHSRIYPEARSDESKEVARERLGGNGAEFSAKQGSNSTAGDWIHRRPIWALDRLPQKDDRGKLFAPIGIPSTQEGLPFLPTYLFGARPTRSDFTNQSEQKTLDLPCKPFTDRFVHSQ